MASRMYFSRRYRGDLGNRWVENEPEKDFLGKGCYGIVYFVTKLDSGVERAVKKVSKASALQNPHGINHEINCLAAVDHPNIIKLHEVIEDQMWMYIVMDYAAGGDLGSFVRTVGRITEKQTRHALQQVIMGVRYLHDMLIVHNDLALRNVVIEQETNTLEKATLKIADFGSASFMSQARTESARDMWSCGIIMKTLVSNIMGDARRSKRHLKIGDVKCPADGWEMVSQDAREFASSLLRKSAIARVTSEQALDHVWLKRSSYDAVMAKDELSLFLGKLRSHAQFIMRKRIALFAMAHLEDDLRYGIAQELFMKLDANGDGLITATEVSDACCKVGVTPPSDLQVLLAACDLDHVGAIDRTTFLSVFVELNSSVGQEIFNSAFELLDLRGSGKIEDVDWYQVSPSTSAEPPGVGLRLAQFISMLKGESSFPSGCMASMHFAGLMLRTRRMASAKAETITCFLDRLIYFERQDIVKKTIMLAIAQFELSHCDDEQVVENQEAFDFLDSSGDGLLTPDKIRSGCRKVGVECPEQIEWLIKRCNHHVRATMDKITFLAVLLDLEVCSEKDSLHAAFQMFDLEGKGYITREDLLRLSHVPVSSGQIDKIVKDVNSSGHIDFDSFISMLRRDSCGIGVTDKLSHLLAPKRPTSPPEECDLPCWLVEDPRTCACKPPHTSSHKQESTMAFDFSESEEFSIASPALSTPRSESSGQVMQHDFPRSERVWRDLACLMKAFAVDPASRHVAVSYDLDAASCKEDNESITGSNVDSRGSDSGNDDDEHSSGDEYEFDANGWKCRLCIARNLHKQYCCLKCGRGLNPAFA